MGEVGSDDALPPGDPEPGHRQHREGGDGDPGPVSLPHPGEDEEVDRAHQGGETEDGEEQPREGGDLARPGLRGGGHQRPRVAEPELGAVGELQGGGAEDGSPLLGRATRHLLDDGDPARSHGGHRHPVDPGRPRVLGERGGVIGVDDRPASRPDPIEDIGHRGGAIGSHDQIVEHVPGGGRHVGGHGEGRDRTIGDHSPHPPQAVGQVGITHHAHDQDLAGGGANRDRFRHQDVAPAVEQLHGEPGPVLERRDGHPVGLVPARRDLDRTADRHVRPPYPQAAADEHRGRDGGRHLAGAVDGAESSQPGRHLQVHHLGLGGEGGPHRRHQGDDAEEGAPEGGRDR